MTILRIERLGGLAGMGGMGSKIRSLGEVDLKVLPDAERRTIESLFDRPAPAPAAGNDRFRYRLTLDSGKMLELDETHVPDRLKNSVVDKLV